MSVTVSNTTANLSGAELLKKDGTHTITGAMTFDRDPSAPFAVTSGSAVVTNLDADKLDGYEATAFLLLAGGTMAGDLLATDATYDIGKSGATRFRDLFLSRNAVVGGTLGVTGVTTLSNQLDISGASAGQVVFPASQNASTNVNTLDDYEEGTWTPVLGGSGGTSGQTYTAQVGSYIKIGKLVFAHGYLALSAKGTITTNVQIQGLPFASQNTTNFSAIIQITAYILATTWVWVTGDMTANTTAATLRGAPVAATSQTTLTTTDIANNTEMVFSIIYRAAA